MQILRRSIQISVWLFILAVPMVNFYGIKLEQKDYNSIRKSGALSFIHAVFKGQDREKAVKITHLVRGSVWTADINGFKISDPLAVFESTIVPMSFFIPLLLSALIPLIFTLILGRAYCGWICPVNLLLEMNDKLRRLLMKFGYNSRDIKFDRRTKYLVLISGVIIALIAGMPLLSLIYPPAIVSREIFYRIFYMAWGNGLLIIAFILIFELVLSRRWWCRYICPGGAIYILLSRFRLLNIVRDDELCNDCGECNPVCPYDLRPMDKEINSECDQCRLCISACEPAALIHRVNLKNIPVKKTDSLTSN